MRDISQLVDDMLKSVVGGYKYGTDPRVGKIRNRSVPSMFMNSPKTQIIVKKRTDQIKENE